MWHVLLTENLMISQGPNFNCTFKHIKVLNSFFSCTLTARNLDVFSCQISWIGTIMTWKLLWVSSVITLSRFILLRHAVYYGHVFLSVSKAKNAYFIFHSTNMVYAKILKIHLLLCPFLFFFSFFVLDVGL